MHEATHQGRSEAVTEGIRIQVSSRYLPERSNPMRRQWLFTYEVTITNESDGPVRLLTRHWVVVDAHGKREDIEGVGVVGETPVIQPGDSHVYQSFCPLPTEFGHMEGSYGMVRPNGETFRATVAPFMLYVPTAVQ